MYVAALENKLVAITLYLFFKQVKSKILPSLLEFNFKSYMVKIDPYFREIVPLTLLREGLHASIHLAPFFLHLGEEEKKKKKKETCKWCKRSRQQC